MSDTRAGAAQVHEYVQSYREEFHTSFTCLLPGVYTVGRLKTFFLMERGLRRSDYVPI